uniref:Uncharacterized protein n=1 Tax=Arion vulgaris TaxID=1028688 RepID=A0A0B7BT13_9EUPU
MSDGLDCSGMLSYSQTRADSTYPLLMDVCRFGDGVESALQMRDFADALTREWDLIPHNFLHRLVHSMRSRCQACLQAHGGH